MNVPQARELGSRIGQLVETAQPAKAYSLLAPVLAQRTPFALLDRIGEAVGLQPLDQVNAFVQQIAALKTEGGWVVVASALSQQLERDFSGALARARGFVIAADIWYATDIMGERVPGPALLAHLNATQAAIASWREDGNRWVRRTVGIAVHFWAKRRQGAPQFADEARSLLTFLEPMFEERVMDAVKGVGWGLKTLGRYYPALVTDWLAEQVTRLQRPHRALMLRKAITYLPPDQRARFESNLGA